VSSAPLNKDSMAQVKSVVSVLIVAYAVLLGLLIPIGIICAEYNMPVGSYTRDPAALVNAHPLIGLISNIGVLFWCATAAICFFASVIHSKKGSARIARFFLFSGLLTSVLLLDDLFMLHDFILPQYLHIDEHFIYLGYSALVITCLIKFRSVISQTEYIVLFIACGFFGLSIICDLVLPQKGMVYLVEDGFKVFGIVTWFVFFTRTCFTQTEQIIGN